MADLTITAANVIAGSSARKRTGVAGVTLTAGQVVYLEAATNTYKLADCDSATAAVRVPVGITLHAALAGQPITIIESGPLSLGAILTAGTVYVLSGTAGAIAPAADLAAGDYTSILGVAASTSVLNVKIQRSGVVIT